MVRKIDELGRVVIPKEMRRILNIKTGSSVEMIINEDKEVVLKKFSEMDNMRFYFEELASLIFESYNLASIVCDDDKIIACRGVNKKDYINKKISFNTQVKNGIFDNEIYVGQVEKFLYQYIICIKSNGFNAGYLILLSNKDIDKMTVKNIEILCTFVSVLMDN